MTNSLPPYPCGCLDRCREAEYGAYQSMAQAMVGGAYCRKRRGEPFKHRVMSDMELSQLGAAQRSDELASKELCIAEDKLREAQARRNKAAEVLNHWLAFTANTSTNKPTGEPK